VKPKICLGTAQFGQPYGITNTSGQVPEEMVRQLLIEARKAEINWLDTAQAYGNAEEVLGRQFPIPNHFNLISKLPAQQRSEFSANDVNTWELNFFKSCQNLNVNTLDSYLLHAPSDLKKPGGYFLEDWLLNLRKRGLVNNLGISIYTAEDLEGVNPALLDLVQLPLSLYDQRLLQDGTIGRLRTQGTNIHVRSIYLQGLLLTPAEQWPAWAPTNVRIRHKKLEELAEQRNCNLIDLALGFALSIKEIEAVVLGVCNVEELTALTKSWRKGIVWLGDEYKKWSLQDPSILDPRNWPP
tara:strand:- start:6173 stop:7063 length:891 start_codon:yes stop_codon:yes gene_type:complete